MYGCYLYAWSPKKKKKKKNLAPRKKIVETLIQSRIPHRSEVIIFSHPRARDVRDNTIRGRDDLILKVWLFLYPEWYNLWVICGPADVFKGSVNISSNESIGPSFPRQTRRDKRLAVGTSAGTWLGTIRALVNCGLGWIDSNKWYR